LSLVFVPAFMAMMDDLGNLVWRFGSRFVGAGKDAEPAAGHAEVKAH